MSLSSNALCAKAKAMYGGRLNKNVYLDLTRKQTIGEVVSYLKSQTSYADALKEIYNLEVFFQVYSMPELKVSSLLLNGNITSSTLIVAGP